LTESYKLQKLFLFNNAIIILYFFSLYGSTQIAVLIFSETLTKFWG